MSFLTGASRLRGKSKLPPSKVSPSAMIIAFSLSLIHICPRSGALDLLKYIGPGLLVTVGFIDPGNWATNLAAGSEFGYALLWVVTFSSVMLIIIQHNVCLLYTSRMPAGIPGENAGKIASRLIRSSLTIDPGETLSLIHILKILGEYAEGRQSV